jgi:hypothetical protein
VIRAGLVLRVVKEEIASLDQCIHPKGVTVFWPPARQHFASRAQVINSTSIEESAMEIWVASFMSHFRTAVWHPSDARLLFCLIAHISHVMKITLFKKFLASRFFWHFCRGKNIDG